MDLKRVFSTFQETVWSLLKGELNTKIKFLLLARTLKITLTYPSECKYGQITPAHKKGDCKNKKNFRPLTVLPAFNTIFEKSLHIQLTEHFDAIISIYQSAFLKHHNTETALLRLVEDWKRKLDAHNYTAVISMYLSKALDSLPHGLLSAKLKAYGVIENSVQLLGSYLTPRYQRVTIIDTVSAWTKTIRLLEVCLKDRYELLKKAGRTTLFSRRIQNIAIMTYKSVNNIAPII